MKNIFLALCLVLMLYVAAAPCQGTASGSNPPEVPEDYIIGLEDVLRINVWDEPELSVEEIMVRPDGKITVPLVNDIMAIGLTPVQLKTEIENKLKDFLTTAPTVTVVVLKIGSRYVSIVGHVTKPGIYYLGSPMTVLELLARAGGFLEYADIKNIAIVRKDGDRSRHFSFNFKDVAKGKNLQQNIPLQNGDVVIVPED